MNSEVVNVLAAINREQFLRLHVPNTKDLAREMESRQKELGPTVAVLEGAGGRSIQHAAAGYAGPVLPVPGPGGKERGPL